MKKHLNYIVISAIAATTLLSQSCEKLLSFEKTLDGGKAEVTISPMGAGTFNVSVDKPIGIEQDLTDAGFSIDNIASVKGRIKEIEIVDDGMQPAITFDIVDQILVEIEASDIARKKVAGKNPMPKDGSRKIKPDMEPDVDWLNIAKKTNVKVHCSGTLNAPLERAVKLNVFLEYDVKAKK